MLGKSIVGKHRVLNVTIPNREQLILTKRATLLQPTNPRAFFPHIPPNFPETLRKALLFCSNQYKLNNMSQPQNQLPMPLSNFSLPYPQNLDALLSFNPSFLLLFNQNQQLLQQNRDLKLLIDSAFKQRSAIAQENQSLRAKLALARELPKRKYAKRRTWLQKKYKCPKFDCNCAYSSKIALNLHIRKRHSDIKIQA